LEVQQRLGYLESGKHSRLLHSLVSKYPLGAMSLEEVNIFPIEDENGLCKKCGKNEAQGAADIQSIQQCACCDGWMHCTCAGLKAFQKKGSVQIVNEM
jgi:hypothetical protein